MAERGQERTRQAQQATGGIGAFFASLFKKKEAAPEAPSDVAPVPAAPAGSLPAPVFAVKGPLLDAAAALPVDQEIGLLPPHQIAFFQGLDTGVWPASLAPEHIEAMLDEFLAVEGDTRRLAETRAPIPDRILDQVAKDGDVPTRIALTHRAQRLTPFAFAVLSKESAPLRADLARRGDLPRGLRDALLQDTDREVRQAAATRHVLFHDENTHRQVLAEGDALPSEAILLALLGDTDQFTRECVAQSPLPLPETVLLAALAHPKEGTRADAALRPDPLPRKALPALLADASPSVRRALALRSDLSFDDLERAVSDADLAGFFGASFKEEQAILRRVFEDRIATASPGRLEVLEGAIKALDDAALAGCLAARRAALASPSDGAASEGPGAAGIARPPLSGTFAPTPIPSRAGKESVPVRS